MWGGSSDYCERFSKETWSLSRGLFGTCLLVNGGENRVSCSWEEQPGLAVPVRSLRGSDRGNGASGSLFSRLPRWLLVFLPQSSLGRETARLPALRGAAPCCHPQPLGSGTPPSSVQLTCLCWSVRPGWWCQPSTSIRRPFQLTAGLSGPGAGHTEVLLHVAEQREAQGGGGPSRGAGRGANLPCPLCPRCCCFFKRKRKKTAQRHK